MKVIIAGSRTITDYPTVAEAIAQSGFTITEMVCGCAAGVERLGAAWATRHAIPVTNFTADWKRYGKNAGIRRNKVMGDYAEALIAVWDGHNPTTKHMIEYARMKKLPVRVILLSERQKIDAAPAKAEEAS